MDDALAWWLAGQAKKPNNNYRWTGTNWERGHIQPVLVGQTVQGVFIPEETLTFPVGGLPDYTFEIFARAAEPNSVPLGASVVPGTSVATGVEISENVDQLNHYGFGDTKEDHSAQFRSTIQRRWSYWQRLLSDFYAL